MADQHPKTIGKYEVLSVLGRGGMGIVYKARDPYVGRLVAVKTISVTQDLSEQELRERLQMEARSAGRLQHPNIATLYDFGTHEDHSYIVLEYVEGTDLALIIDQKIPLSLPQKIDILIQIANGLAFAHELGVVHRDMKPSNVRVTTRGEAKIIDFGLARFDSTRLTKTGFMTGTIAYMSPERIHGEAGPSDDIFALGTIGYELLTYRRAFPGSTPPEVIMKIISQSPPPPSTVEPIPPELDAIVMKGMAREVADRYSTPAQYADALEEFRHSEAWRQHLTEIGAADVPIRSRSLRGDLSFSEIAATARTNQQELLPTAVNPSPLDESDAPATVITPADDRGYPSESSSAPTVIEREGVPGSKRWRVGGAVAAATAAVALATVLGLGRWMNDAPQTAGPIPGDGIAISSLDPVGSTRAPAPPSGPTSEQANEIEINRRLLASLRQDVAALGLDAEERTRLDRAIEAAELAEQSYRENDFNESQRLLASAIDALRDLRQDHYQRFSRPSEASKSPPAETRRDPTPPRTRSTPVAEPAPPRARQDAPATQPEAQPVPPPAETRPSAPASTEADPPAPSPTETRRDVTAFIERIARAYTERDVDFFRRHDANFSSRIGDAIRSSPSVRVEMKIESIDLVGPTRARVVLQRTDSFSSSNIPPGVQRLAYTLERAESSWRIASVDRL